MKLLNTGSANKRAYGGKIMKIILLNSYPNKERRLAEIESELAVLDEKLKTPARTLDDIIRHIELLKEKQSFLN